MVWRVPESPPDPDLPPDYPPSSLASLTSTQSPDSASLELGSAPGSGMALDSRSDSGSETETVTTSSRSPSVPLTTSLYEDPGLVAWSAEVEEMINNPPPGKFESFSLSGDPSMSSWVVPTSDRKETQNSLRGRKTSISPVNEIDEALPNKPSHSPSPIFLSRNEPLEDFTGHLAGEGHS